jgi:hypothetical protein
MLVEFKTHHWEEGLDTEVVMYALQLNKYTGDESGHDVASTARDA